MEAPVIHRAIEEVRSLAHLRPTDLLVAAVCQSLQRSTYVVVQAIVVRENVIETEDDMIRLFRPEAGLVARDNVILSDPFNWAASISPVVGEVISGHVIGAQYHVGRWHGTTLF